MIQERDNSIDILRFIGLSLIVLAHIHPPEVLFNFRCFDVPLMIFVSGLTCSGKQIGNYWEYIWKRTKRLIIPTYLFLTAYFAFLFVLSLVFSKPGLISWQRVVDSYLLLDGIGYVWIIRVFLLIMLVTPLLLRMEKWIKNDKLLLVSVLMGGGITTIVAIYSESLCDNILKSIISEWIVYLMGYSLMFILGLRMRHISQNRERSMATWVFVVAMGLLGYYFGTNGLCLLRLQDYKYPPQSYYLMYGLLMCSVIWRMRKGISKVFDNKIALFIGQNTIWIYLYHIFFLYITYKLPINWLIRYVIVYAFAVFVTFIQYRIAHNRKGISKYLVG